MSNVTKLSKIYVMNLIDFVRKTMLSSKKYIYFVTPFNNICYGNLK